MQTQKSISFAGTKLWKSLPNEKIQESDFKKFKACMKQFALNTSGL